MKKTYWGPEFTEAEVKAEIEARRKELDQENCAIEFVSNDEELCKRTAQDIADGKVVGWFQGRMEWGPRALGMLNL